jgi:hypothetical protein
MTNDTENFLAARRNRTPNPGVLTKRLECVMFIKVPSNRAKTGEAGCWYEVGEGRKVPEDVEPERARLLGAFYFLCSSSVSCGLSAPIKDRFLYSSW